MTGFIRFHRTIDPLHGKATLMRRPDRKRTSTRRSPLNVEGLEERQLLSAARVAHDSIVTTRSLEKAIAHLHEEALVSHAESTAKAMAHVLETSRRTVGGETDHVTPKIVPLRSPFLSSFIISSKGHTSRRNGQIVSFSPPNTTITPSQMATAYGVNLLPTSNQGQGVTIAIVDELVDPTITSDVAAFSTQFGLPQLNGLSGNGKLAIVNDTALGTPGTSPAGDTSIETALDVEWAHAMAPKANILLVFVPETGSLVNQFDQILHGVQLAATPSTATNLGLPPVVVVSTSYGYFTGTVTGGGRHPETFTGFTPAQEQALDTTYLSTGAATNVALTFSTGDYSLPLYPAASPNVIAVGGTTLYTTARGRYLYEYAWGGVDEDGAGGGGISTAFSLPTFQKNAGLSDSGRAIPDISMDADPISGVAVYSANDASVNDPAGDPWFQVGGTSLASPMFAGIIALAQQNRIDASQPILNSVGINDLLYGAYVSNYSTYFHDVVFGNNNDIGETDFGGSINIMGSNAGVGYDLATGIGSPIGNKIVSLLG